MHGSVAAPPQVQPYDLSRPCPLRPEELSRLQVAAADFARSFSALAGEYLGVSAQFHVRSVGRSDRLLSATGDTSVWVVASGLESELCPVWRFDWPLASDLVNAMVGCQGASRAPERVSTGSRAGFWPICAGAPCPPGCLVAGEESVQTSAGPAWQLELAGTNPDEWAGVCSATGLPCRPDRHSTFHSPWRDFPHLPSVRTARSPPPGDPSPLVRSAPLRVTVELARGPPASASSGLHPVGLVDLGRFRHRAFWPLCCRAGPELKVRPGVHRATLCPGGRPWSPERLNASPVRAQARKKAGREAISPGLVIFGVA